MQKNRVLLMIAGKSCFVLEIIMCPHLFLHQQGSRVEFQAEAEGTEIIAVNDRGNYIAVVVSGFDGNRRRQQLVAVVSKENQPRIPGHADVHILDDAVAHGGFQNRADRIQRHMVKEQLQKRRVKLLAGALRHNLVGDVGRICLFVRPLGGQGILYISNSYDFGKIADAVIRQMAWIAAAVQMLMVLVGDVGDGSYIQAGGG